MLRVISTVVATRAQPSVCQVLDRALGRLAWHTAAQETPGAWMRTMPPRVGTGGRWWGLPVAADLTAGISASHSPTAPPASAPPAQSCGAQARAPAVALITGKPAPVPGPPAKEVTLQGHTGGTGQGCTELCLTTSKPHASHQEAGFCLHMFLSRDIMPGFRGDTGPGLVVHRGDTHRL